MSVGSAIRRNAYVAKYTVALIGRRICNFFAKSRFTNVFAAVVFLSNLASPSIAQSPDYPFPPPIPITTVAPGFAGTAFRGLALGQARSDAELALETIGLRCITEAEFFAEIAKGSPSSASATPQAAPLVEDVAGYEVCRISRAPELSQNPLLGVIEYLDEVYMGIPRRAIIFKDGTVSALSLPPDFFNSAGLDAYNFALAIVENYPLPNDFSPLQSGWSGLTASNELVEIRVSPNGLGGLMTVRLPVATDIPTFD